jgi:hypothetical protein
MSFPSAILNLGMNKIVSHKWCNQISTGAHGCRLQGYRKHSNEKYQSYSGSCHHRTDRHADAVVTDVVDDTVDHYC